MSPDRRQHRGAHPADSKLFDATRLAVLRQAVGELSWLLTRGYSQRAALKLVGDRHSLCERQRLCVSRAACSDQSLARRREHQLPLKEIKGESLVVDGFNLIITAEAALGGGLLFYGRDACVRDLSGVHGSYRSVRETETAIALIGEALGRAGPREVRWLLDRPISNSGRLAARIKELALQREWPWSVETVFNPDREILASGRVALTSDSIILDNVGRWTDFNEHLVRNYLTDAWLIDLRG